MSISSREIIGGLARQLEGAYNQSILINSLITGPRNVWDKMSQHCKIINPLPASVPVKENALQPLHQNN